MDTPDTLTLARLDRENQGNWEADYSYGGETDLHRNYDKCAKDPGHKNFIPVDKFSIEDLPEEYRDKDVMDYVRAISDLTVRVIVKYVSDKRPKTDGVSGKPFPGYCYRGQRRITVGTGCVNHVRVQQESEHETCRCKDCLASSKPQTKFGKIDISTASHVVYDESEAAHTTCHLYFDRGGRPETCKGVVALTDMSHDTGDRKTDRYYMSHYTHDLDLAHRLHQRCKQRFDLQNKFNTKPSYKYNLKTIRPALYKQPLLIIVSHPHGCSKQISIGRCHSLLPQPDKQCGYTYTTATCPGSSGAGVHVLLTFALPEWDFHVAYTSVHRGVCDKQPGMNESLLNPGSLVPEMVSLDLLLRDEEEPSEFIFCAEEEDLGKHYDTCQNNPGHQNFYPVDKFSVDHLPHCNCKDEIMELIKVMSDLTVRVSVRYVSVWRLETVPGTNIPYPWYRNRGSNQLRLGSGRITKVEFPDNRAPTVREFARIHISTAHRFVYDDLEGEQTTCHLFFDSGETPDACKDVVTLTNACETQSHVFEDSCNLVYCTHDLALARRLEVSVQLYKDLARLCHSSYNHEIVKQNGRKNLTPKPPLNIVVSHPHGRAKHVSVSFPGCHGNTDTEEIQLPYKSITCPGSGGAPVITLGTQPLYPCCK